jgi:hypothetical protein
LGLLVCREIKAGWGSAIPSVEARAFELLEASATVRPGDPESMFPPTRIICLTEETVETLYLLGEQDRIVGISGYVVRPPQARREKPRVSAFTSANVDKFLALKSDLFPTFSDLHADIAAHSIRRGLDIHKRDLDIVAALGRAFGHTNMGVYAEIVAGGETAVGDALLMKSGV